MKITILIALTALIILIGSYLIEVFYEWKTFKWVKSLRRDMGTIKKPFKYFKVKQGPVG